MEVKRMKLHWTRYVPEQVPIADLIYALTAN
jgi:hypothetical protein